MSENLERYLGGLVGCVAGHLRAEAREYAGVIESDLSAGDCDPVVVEMNAAQVYRAIPDCDREDVRRHLIRALLLLEVEARAEQPPARLGGVCDGDGEN